jgi:hypothetical protein
LGGLNSIRYLVSEFVVVVEVGVAVVEAHSFVAAEYCCWKQRNKEEEIGTRECEPNEVEEVVGEDSKKLWEFDSLGDIVVTE